MPSLPTTLVDKVEALRTYRSGERRAPHKPLLLLIAIAELLHGRRRLAFSDVEEKLLPLLTAFAPPVMGAHQPELPYWHLQSDGLWVVEGADGFPRQKGGFPRMGPLRQSFGRLPDVVVLELEDPAYLKQVVATLLNEHFPPTMHDDILAAIGLEVLPSDDVKRSHMTSTRAPNFRVAVLRAYEHRCAVTGFRAALAGAYFGCEAAHVQWHAYDGPDVVANGIVLEPTLHKLFDAGAWTLTDDRRILVSREYTGTDAAVDRLRARHGQPLRSPLPGEPVVDSAFIRWHREPALGGVFRGPALSAELA